MSDRAARARSCRIVVLGSNGEFTALAVETLCLSGVSPAALVTCGPPATVSAPAPTYEARASIPVEVGAPAARITAAHGVALISARNPNRSDTITAVERFAPDLLLIACLPTILSRAARRTARLGALNLHPSALPRYRGPDPVFWQLRDGIRRAGVTVHVATGSADAGPIVAQRMLEVRPGIGAPALTAALVRSGILALVEELPEIERRIREAAAQDESAATCQPGPSADDFRIDTSWRAERAYRFIAGISGSGATFTIVSDEGEIEVERAVGFDSTARCGPAVRHRGEFVTIRFADGMLRAVPARSGQASTASSSSNPNVDMSRMREG